MEEKKSTTPSEPNAVSQERPTPVRKMFPTVGDVLAMLGIVFSAQILVGLFVLLVSRVMGIQLETNELEQGKYLAVAYFFSMLVALAGVVYYRRVRGGRGTWARFSLRGLNPVVLVWAFVLIFAVGVVIEPLLTLLPEISLPVGRGFWTVASLVLFAPVFEELLCRGVVLGSLRAKYGVTVAWLISSLFFGILHGQPAQVVGAFAIGLILGYVYLATDSLWATMILHAMNNAVAYLFMINGYADAQLLDLIESRTLYVIIYIAALALAIVSGYMMRRKLRSMKSEEKNHVAA